MLPNDLEALSKGEQIKALFLEKLPPSERERFRVLVAKDRKGLTKVRISLRIQARDDGNMGGGESP